MFVTRIIGKSIISAALFGGGFILFKRIKKKNRSLDKDKVKK